MAPQYSEDMGMGRSPGSRTAYLNAGHGLPGLLQIKTQYLFKTLFTDLLKFCPFLTIFNDRQVALD
jgi:hypothetical protein